MCNTKTPAARVPPRIHGEVPFGDDWLPPPLELVLAGVQSDGVDYLDEQDEFET